MIREPLSNSSEWTFELIQTYEKEIARIAESYQLDTFPNQIEIISSEQMMDAYSAVGMPVGYYHWSFGRQFLEVEQEYLRGHTGLAYEIVINSNPCISYLLEENTMTMQALVIAHACYGHNSFFKNNYLFKTWTNPNSIIDYLIFARNYVSQCEERFGVSAVEEILDACHALRNYGVDRYRHPPKLSLQKEKIRQKKREEYLQQQVNELWRTLPAKEVKSENIIARYPAEPEENILYFLEKSAPLLEPWQREIVRIVRKISQYFYPQRQTKVMNEGWACFWHYRLLNDMFDQGLVTDQFMLEFLKAHTGVIFQPNYDSPHFSGINPYTLGYKMMMDIRRICENPNEEDQKWFPDIAGSDWLKTLDFAMRNFKDESFISQYLSPSLMRELKLFAILDDDNKNDYLISAIHDENGYRHVRQILSDQFNLSCTEPNIQVYNVDHRGDRSLTLRYHENQRRTLAPEDLHEVMKHLYFLWKFPVRLECEYPDGTVKLIAQCPEE